MPGTAGTDPGEVKWVNFHPPFSEPLFNHADAQTSNTSTRLWFCYIVTKIHPPVQNPGSAPEQVIKPGKEQGITCREHLLYSAVSSQPSWVLGCIH